MSNRKKLPSTKMAERYRRQNAGGNLTPAQARRVRKRQNQEQAELDAAAAGIAANLRHKGMWLPGDR